MLSAALLTGLVAAPIATALLFVRPVFNGRASGGWPWTRRLVLALAGTLLLAAVSAGLLALIGVTAQNLVAGAAGLVVTSIVWLPVTRRWSARAHLCWAATTYLFVAYLAFMLEWTFRSGLGVAGITGALVLWSLEVWAAFLGCAYLWELCDALGREHWERRVIRGVVDPVPDALREPSGAGVQRAARDGHRDAEIPCRP